MPYILHIDDSPTISAKVSAELQGIEVKLLKRFIDLTQLREKPLLAILDLNMPAFTGEEMSKHIVSCFGKIPIIIFSGEKEERLLSAKKIIGADFAISKLNPKAFEELRRAVQLICKSSTD